MTRIFLALAALAVALLLTNIFLGLSIGDLNGSYRQLRDVQLELAQQRSRIGGQDALPQRLEALLRERYGQLEPQQRRASWHRLLGILAALVALLVNSISVTYFIGTSRWCQEVVDTYQLDTQLTARSNRLKRRTFPWSLGAIGLLVVITALGAAADPGTLRPGTAAWVTPHLVAALGGVFLIAMALLAQINLIAEHSEVIEQVLAEVRRIRSERGWELDEQN